MINKPFQLMSPWEINNTAMTGSPLERAGAVAYGRGPQMPQNDFQIGASAADDASGAGEDVSFDPSDSPMGFDPSFLDMARAAGNEAPTDQDKGMALAEAGFGAAASGSPTFLGAIGAGGMQGLRALQQMQQDRAVNQLKAATLANAMANQHSLQQYRNSIISNKQAGIMDPEELSTMVNVFKKTGDMSLFSKLGVGTAGTINRKNMMAAINNDPDINQDDFAQKYVDYQQLLKQQQAVGTGTGQRMAGTFKENLGAGESTPGPVAPPVTLGGKPAVSAPAAVSQIAPAVAPPSGPKLNLDAIPDAIPLPQPNSVGEKFQTEQKGSELGKLEGQIDTQAKQAVDQNYLIDQMRNESKSWDMGKLAPTLMNGKAYLVAINNTLPDAYKLDDSKMSESVGDFQAMNKNAMELSRQVVRATSARAAYQEMQMIQQALPSPEMTPQGFSQIADQLQGANDYVMARQKAKDLWNRKNSNNLNGFDPWFNDNYSPALFLLNRMAPPQRETAVRKMQETPVGRATLKKLAVQGKTAMSLGLLGQ